MTIQEKMYDLAMLDALPNPKELAFAVMDDEELCYKAVVHYLRFNPNVWDKLSKDYN